MSNTRYPWWGYARKIIYLYPERCRQHQEMLRQKYHARVLRAGWWAYGKQDGRANYGESDDRTRIQGV